MFGSNSRYYNLDNATLMATGADGKPRPLVYKRRRFIPTADNTTLLVEHSVAEGDRLDNLADTYIQDPTQYWLICDANGALRPSDVLQPIGRLLQIVTTLG